MKMNFEKGGDSGISIEPLNAELRQQGTWGIRNELTNQAKRLVNNATYFQHSEISIFYPKVLLW